MLLKKATSFENSLYLFTLFTFKHYMFTFLHRFHSRIARLLNFREIQGLRMPIFYWVVWSLVWKCPSLKFHKKCFNKHKNSWIDPKWRQMKTIPCEGHIIFINILWTLDSNFYEIPILPTRHLKFYERLSWVCIWKIWKWSIKGLKTKKCDFQCSWENQNIKNTQA